MFKCLSDRGRPCAPRQQPCGAPPLACAFHGARNQGAGIAYHRISGTNLAPLVRTSRFSQRLPKPRSLTCASPPPPSPTWRCRSRPHGPVRAVGGAGPHSPQRARPQRLFRATSSYSRRGRIARHSGGPVRCLCAHDHLLGLLPSGPPHREPLSSVPAGPAPSRRGLVASVRAHAFTDGPLLENAAAPAVPAVRCGPRLHAHDHRQGRAAPRDRDRGVPNQSLGPPTHRAVRG